MCDKFFPNKEECKLCVSCWYARQRKDVCGIYCTQGFVKDGKCDMHEDYYRHKKRVRLERLKR